jgi:hypothetical protein
MSRKLKRTIALVTGGGVSISLRSWRTILRRRRSARVWCEPAGMDGPASVRSSIASRCHLWTSVRLIGCVAAASVMSL